MKIITPAVILFTLGISSNAFSKKQIVHEFYQDKELTVFETLTQQPLNLEVFTRNFTKTDKIKLSSAIEILQHVMNSKEFKKAVLNFEFQGKKQFYENKGMTNEEIYQHLMTGAEDLDPVVDHVMDFDLTMYRSKNPWSKVKGYTTPGSKRIYIHSKFYRRRSWTPVDVAANMAHEWVHKMGFGHDYNYNADRPYSVPYGIGGIVSRVAKELGYQD